jgi:hypothetical protein
MAGPFTGPLATCDTRLIERTRKHECLHAVSPKFAIAVERRLPARLGQSTLRKSTMSMAGNIWLGLLASFAAAAAPVSARPYYGYGHPTYGYSYGPEFNYGYFASPIFGRGSNDKIYPYRNLGCPILCIGGYWQDTRKRPIAIIRGDRILIR